MLKKDHTFTSDDKVQGDVLWWYRNQPKEFFVDSICLICASVGFLSKCMWRFLITVAVPAPESIIKWS
jgi:hypothetical protein